MTGVLPHKKAEETQEEGCVETEMTCLKPKNPEFAGNTVS
jgi:hypothetical protein